MHVLHTKKYIIHRKQARKCLHAIAMNNFRKVLIRHLIMMPRIAIKYVKYKERAFFWTIRCDTVHIKSTISTECFLCEGKILLELYKYM